MTLEQVSYIADIVASAAIVASLIYVARQLAQNTAMMRVSASGERVQREFDIGEPFIENRELAEIWMKGGAEFDSLEPVDAQRLIFFERRALVHWYNMFTLHEEGLLSDEDWRELTWLIPRLINRQTVREAWRVFKGGFSASFQDFVDGELAKIDAPASAR